ncbi:MAG: hypothetical protein IKZ47_02190 [Clostridia bacterium]|nr:hypothetical protein [Clostridia bacterium]
MRWSIVKNKRMTETKDLEGHTESLEMSGERVSGIIGYGAKGGKLRLTRDIVFPSFRIQPNDTHGSYCVRGAAAPVLLGEETFEKAQISGILTLFSHTGNALIKRSFYPSTTLSCFYEDIKITAVRGDVTPVYEETERLETKLGCEGYIYADRVADGCPGVIKKGETRRIVFTYRAYFANAQPPFETDPLNKRIKRVEELLSVCDLTTGDDVIDTEFAFAKIRAGESLFRTKKGLIHCPGGYDYYAAVWCNDQLEYAAPWFAFTGDKKAMEASVNAFRLYEPYMNDEYRPIPSSIVAEGLDYWNGAGDRGDAAMYLFGLSRYLLTVGKAPDAGQERALDWCTEYIARNITEEGAVFSDSDELEGRISTGVNLATASLSYGGLGLLSVLWQRCGKEDKSQKAEKLKERIKGAFEGYFGAGIGGFKTYAYHKGCKEVRAWNCLPVYMGVFDRANDTLASIESALLSDNGLKTHEGENVTWDRSTLYFITSLFRAGQTEKAFSLLKGYSEKRLLGERVPYPVEAYPEGNMRHLSAESALYCRVITDGILNIAFNKGGYTLRESVPFIPGGLSLKNVFTDGKYTDIEIK